MARVVLRLAKKASTEFCQRLPFERFDWKLVSQLSGGVGRDEVALISTAHKSCVHVPITILLEAFHSAQIFTAYRSCASAGAGGGGGIRYLFLFSAMVRKAQNFSLHEETKKWQKQFPFTWLTPATLVLFHRKWVHETPQKHRGWARCFPSSNLALLCPFTAAHVRLEQAEQLHKLQHFLSSHKTIRTLKELSAHTLHEQEGKNYIFWATCF